MTGGARGVGEQVEVQIATRSRHVPSRVDLAGWAAAALAHGRVGDGLTVRVVGRAEGAALNERYRGRVGHSGPTNVLAFPFEPPPGIPHGSARLLGDVVVCAPVAAREAIEQGKPAHDHWAHLVIHGVLHLLGYDHADPAQADAMETVERRLLACLGIPDPYAGAPGRPPAPAAGG